VKEAEIRKEVAHTGVNTDEPVPAAPAQPIPRKQPNFIHKLLQIESPMFDFFSSFLVRRRIHRSATRAKKCLLMIPC
jgi:hypothetical protein